MKRYRAYSDPKGTDQIIFKAKNITEARKIARPKMKQPKKMKIYCQTINKD